MIAIFKTMIKEKVMASISSLSLLQILHFLYTEAPEAGETRETFGKIRQHAEHFAHQILGRGLEHLTADARLLLLFLEAKIETFCHGFFSRTQLRKMLRWPNERLKACLDSLLQANYLRAHQKKNSIAYELLQDSASRRRSYYVMQPTGAYKVGEEI